MSVEYKSQMMKDENSGFLMSEDGVDGAHADDENMEDNDADADLCKKDEADDGDDDNNADTEDDL